MDIKKDTWVAEFKATMLAEIPEDMMPDDLVVINEIKVFINSVLARYVASGNGVFLSFRRSKGDCDLEWKFEAPRTRKNTLEEKG